MVCEKYCKRENDKFELKVFINKFSNGITNDVVFCLLTCVAGTTSGEPVRIKFNINYELY